MTDQSVDPAAADTSTGEVTPPADDKTTTTQSADKPVEGDKPVDTPVEGDKPTEGDKPADKTDDQPASDTDWAKLREKLAKGDEKALQRLSRYSSLESVVEALFNAQKKISEGIGKGKLPDDATEEEIAAYRKENGIPEKPEDYDLSKVPEDIVIGEEDEPQVKEFLAEAHKLNLNNKQVQETLGWYFKSQEKMVDERNAMDLEAKEKAEEELRDAWGAEFKTNKNIIINTLEGAPEGVSQLILGARLADGTPLASHAATLRWLADVGRKLNPTATVVPGSGTNAVQAIETEKAELEKMMGDHDSEYWKGPKSAQLQERYRKLIEAEQLAR